MYLWNCDEEEMIRESKNQILVPKNILKESCVSIAVILHKLHKT